MHLAQIQKHRFGGSSICLLAEKRPDRLWITIASTPDRLLPLPHQYHHLAEGVLVLVELGSKREIIKLTPALPEILKLLQDWSLRVLQSNSEKARIDEWQDSLSLQTFELRKLHEEFDRQKSTFAIEKSRLKEVVNSLQARVNALAAENEALKSNCKAS